MGKDIVRQRSGGKAARAVACDKHRVGVFNARLLHDLLHGEGVIGIAVVVKNLLLAVGVSVAEFTSAAVEISRGIGKEDHAPVLEGTILHIGYKTAHIHGDVGEHIRLHKLGVVGVVPGGFFIETGAASREINHHLIFAALFEECVIAAALGVLHTVVGYSVPFPCRRICFKLRVL